MRLSEGYGLNFSQYSVPSQQQLVTMSHKFLSPHFKNPLHLKYTSQVPLPSHFSLPHIAESPLLSNWLERISKFRNDSINAIEIQSADFFGGKKLGFLKMKVSTEQNPQGFVVLLRGGTVAVLLQLRVDGKIHIPLVQMTSIPIAYQWFASLPAGMVEATDGSIQNVATREIMEETGIQVKKEDLLDLFSLLYHDNTSPLTQEAYKDASERSQLQGMYPSVGILDEHISMFMSKPIDMTQEQLDSLQHQQHGNKEENENIRLLVVPIEEAYRYSSDAKLLSALYLREKALAHERFPKDFL